MAKVLLVDDHPDIVRLLETTLRRDGYTLLKAFDGVQAMDQVRAERPDVVILDVVMPELDGFRVLSRIKTDPELRDTVVIMLTARDDPGDMTLGLDAGTDFYLCKPFRPDEVASLVRRVLLTRDGGGDEAAGSGEA